MQSKIEAKEVQEDFKIKLTEINLKIEELDIQVKELNEVKDSNNIETVLAEYRLKLDHLDGLIANLTKSLHPSNDSEFEVDSTTKGTKNTWRNLIDLRLKRAKEVIYKFAYRPSATTVTKYLPTGNQKQHFKQQSIHIHIPFSCDQDHCAI